MYQIELSIPYTMSLLVNSSTGSDEPEEIKEEEEEENEEIDALSMSDEEFEKLSEEDFAIDGSSDSEEEENKNLGDDDQSDSEHEANEDEPADSAEEGGSEQAEYKDDTEEKQPSEEQLKSNQQAYEVAYNELFGQPIKASGREVQLKDVNQARNLIEMGVDYNKKMQHMRHHMQTLKTLEKEGILDDASKMNLLIEAQQGKPEAIRKLIAQSDIDMLDLADQDENQEYTPDNHIVSQNEVEIDAALSAIKQSPTYDRTLDVMSNSFDQKSRQIIANKPEYITSLNSDIESGIYDKVMDMVQYQRDIRAIPDNVSDIEAYIGTVQQLAQIEQQQELEAQSQGQGVQNQQVQGQPNNKQQPQNKAVRKRKNAMSGSKSSGKGQKKEYDPMEIMSMSDDDFDKKFGSELL